MMVPDIKTGRQTGGMYGGSSIAASYTPTPLIPKQVTKEHREAYVHSSVVFLADTGLRLSTTEQYTIRLETAVDVAKARDIKTRHKVKMKLA